MKKYSAFSLLRNAMANLLIGLVDDHPTFEIVVRRSFAEYLAFWFKHAAGEYRVRFSVG